MGQEILDFSPTCSGAVFLDMARRYTCEQRPASHAAIIYVYVQGPINVTALYYQRWHYTSATEVSGE